MLRLLCCLFISELCCLPRQLAAQSDSTQAYELREVLITALPYNRYGVGLQSTTTDSLLAGFLPAQSLGDILLQNTDAYIKAYGSGMLQSISLRGTAAGHTAVLWNGVNINSPTLGEADFSTLPLAGGYQVQLIQGGSSPLAGSDAIGGAILLESGKQNSTLPLSIQTAYRSTQQWSARLQTGWKAGTKLSGFSQLYGSYAKNIFENRLIKPYQTIDYAPFHFFGTRQEFFYEIKKGQEINFYSWYHEHDRILLSNRARQIDKNLRTLLQYRDHKQLAQLSFVRNFLEYNESSQTNTHQWQAQYQYEIAWNQSLSSRAGATATLIQTDVDSYEGQPERRQLETFVFTQWEASTRLHIALNLRKVWVNAYAPPLSPSLGFDYLLFSTAALDIKTGGSASFNYKLPSLNALYWQPGGNPDIRPESGFYNNIYFQLRHRHHQQLWQLNIEGFRNHINDWILWQPTPEGYWAPDNLKEVLSWGLQTSLSHQLSTPRATFSQQLHYTFTRATNQKAVDAADWASIGKQLPYVPAHRLSGLLKWQHYRQWLVIVNGQWTGTRYTTTDNKRSLPPFWTMDVHAGKQWQIRDGQLNLQIGILNMLDKAYEQIDNQPQPGRQYQVSLQWSFLSNK
ncbi:TonB-dependent receptor plug domain-containing protein [Thermonema rossianum]|uniref:TonB-dependent receptor plug domain-containing protein n=1 Tax=Thermonema rossianum TaxID=55505 RepID=UPI00056EEF02|nr:TonB-dependent receptor plug domain-containing protein [Thermonema rossianum]